MNKQDQLNVSGSRTEDCSTQHPRYKIGGADNVMLRGVT